MCALLGYHRLAMNPDMDVLVTYDRLNSDMEPDPAGPWVSLLYWCEIDGSFEVVGIELRSVVRPADWGGEPAESPRAHGSIPAEPAVLTPKMLQRLLPRLEVRHRVRTYAETLADLPRDDDHADLGTVVQELWEPATQERGRPKLPRSHYKTVAGIYVAALAEGRNDPTVAVGEAFGGHRSVPNIGTSISNYRSASNWVTEARRLGYLEAYGDDTAEGPPTIPG